jgi:hypothetical protein
MAARVAATAPSDAVLRDPNRSSDPNETAVITVQSASVELRNLRIGDSRAFGVVALGPSTAVLEQVVVEEAEGFGLVACNRLRLEATSSFIRNTGSLPDGPAP